MSSSWTFLTNHAHVLFCISENPDVRTRDIAAQVGITEREPSGSSPSWKKPAICATSGWAGATTTNSRGACRSVTPSRPTSLSRIFSACSTPSSLSPTAPEGAHLEKDYVPGVTTPVEPSTWPRRPSARRDVASPHPTMAQSPGASMKVTKDQRPNRYRSTAFGARRRSRRRLARLRRLSGRRHTPRRCPRLRPARH